MANKIIDLSSRNGTAHFLLLNCKMLRVGAGKTISDLAKASNISRDTIRKIEKHLPVTEPIIYGVFNTLNNWHKNNLDNNVEITKKGPINSLVEV